MRALQSENKKQVGYYLGKLQDGQDSVWGMGAIEWKNSKSREDILFEVGGTSVREINKQRDTEGITYARKAIIMTGMDLKTNGRSEESQLTAVLQNIIKKHREEFESASLHDVEAGR